MLNIFAKKQRRPVRLTSEYWLGYGDAQNSKECRPAWYALSEAEQENYIHGYSAGQAAMVQNDS